MSCLLVTILCLCSLLGGVRIHRSCPGIEGSVWSHNKNETRLWAVAFIEYHPLFHNGKWRSAHLFEQLPIHLEIDQCELKSFDSFDHRAFQTSHGFIIACQDGAPTFSCADDLLPVPLLASTIGDLIVKFIAKDDFHHVFIMYDTARRIV